MPVVCKKCGYERRASDTAPDFQCPQCGAIYAKVDAYLKRQQEERDQQAILEAQAQRAEQERQVRDAEMQRLKQIKEQYICTDCGYLGKPIKITKGSIFIEIILWLAFLIPGLIYSIWRLTTKYRACPKCRHESIIPADSPRGQKLIEELNA